MPVHNQVVFMRLAGQPEYKTAAECCEAGHRVGQAHSKEDITLSLIGTGHWQPSLQDRTAELLLSVSSESAAVRVVEVTNQQ